MPPGPGPLSWKPDHVCLGLSPHLLSLPLSVRQGQLSCRRSPSQSNPLSNPYVRDRSYGKGAVYAMTKSFSSHLAQRAL